jgi:membrane fusion protein, multidrug efflux system
LTLSTSRASNDPRPLFSPCCNATAAPIPERMLNPFHYLHKQEHTIAMVLIIRAAGLVLGLAATAGLGACTETGGGEPQNAGSGSGRPPVAVTVAPAFTADVVDAVDVVGSLAPKFSAEIKSEVSGTVTAVYVTQWVPVRKGAPLARLDTSETEAGLDALKAVVAQAQVGEARARREHERALQLGEFGLITRQALDEAASALEAAEAATRAARAQVRTGEARLAKSSIHAPMDGVVAERNVNVGDRVENMGGDSYMFRIVDNRLLDLTVAVPSAHLAGLRVGQPLEFTTDGVPGRTFVGKVMFINPAVDPASRSAKVVAEVPNTDGALRGGLFVRGRIVTRSRRDVLHVAREALLNWNVGQETADVFLVRDGQALKRTVRVGTAGESRVEITAGLVAGDAAVTRGGFALRDGDKVTVAAGGKS